MNCGPGGTTARSSSTVPTSSITPTRTSLALSSGVITNLNSLSGGSGKFALAAYMTSIDYTQFMLLCARIPSLAPQMSLS
jgi:hypothetical protein